MKRTSEWLARAAFLWVAVSLGGACSDTSSAGRGSGGGSGTSGSGATGGGATSTSSGAGSGGSSTGDVPINVVPTDAGAKPGQTGCVNLQCQQTTCPDGTTTSVSGTVYDP